jgi:hypothetical protein
MCHLFRLSYSQVERRIFNNTQKYVFRTDSEFALLQAERHASIATPAPLVE